MADTMETSGAHAGTFVHVHVHVHVHYHWQRRQMKGQS